MVRICFLPSREDDSIYRSSRRMRLIQHVRSKKGCCALCDVYRCLAKGTLYASLILRYIIPTMVSAGTMAKFIGPDGLENVLVIPVYATKPV
jgi:hypothetical protein